jgi:hypothetical protein
MWLSATDALGPVLDQIAAAAKEMS